MFIQAIDRYFGTKFGGFDLIIGEVYKLESIEYVNDDNKYIIINIDGDEPIYLPNDDVFQCTIRDLETNKVRTFWSFYFDIKPLRRNIIINEILEE